MNKKERVIAALKGDPVDRIPWTMYRFFPPMGESELNFRNNGLSITYFLPAYKILIENIKVKEEVNYIFEETKGSNIINRIFSVPCGEISCKHHFIIDNSVSDLGDNILKNEHSLEQTFGSWIKEYPFKNEGDYKLLEYFYNNLKYVSLEEEYVKATELIGSEGIVMLSVGRSPFQKLLYELMGYERCYYEYYDNRKKFLSLYQLLYKRQKEIYNIAAKSSAKAIWIPDNITSLITPPNFYKEFCLPFYNEMAELLHRNEKIILVHMDGNLKSLADLISKTDIDVIEAFNPLPMGDISISEARTLWSDKVIWMNYPGSIITLNDINIIKSYTMNILRDIAPGDKFLIGCTENFPLDNWDKVFIEICKVLNEYGQYPIDI